MAESLQQFGIGNYLYKVREFWATRGKPREIFDEAGAFGQMLRKGLTAQWGGDEVAQHAIEHILGGNVGADFSSAVTYASTSSGERFRIPLAEQWAILQLTWRFMELTKQPGFSLANQSGQVERQMRRMKSWMKTLSYTVWGDGTGRIARGNGAYNVAGLVISLKNRQTTRRFDIGDVIVFVDNSNNTRAGQVVIDKINRSAGTLTVKAYGPGVIAAITDAIPQAQNTDWIAKAVDRANTTQIMLGFSNWVPTTHAVAATTFLGVNRSQDPERLAGWRIPISAAATPWQVVQAIGNLAAQESVPINTIMIPMHLWEQFENEYKGYLSSDPQWTTTGADPKTLTWGVKGIKYERPELPEPIVVTQDRYLNNPDATEIDDKTYVAMRREGWRLITTTSGVDWWDMTGNGRMQQIVGSQQVLGAFGTMGNIVPDHPGENIVASPLATVS